jgi:chemotaxis protein methyltransferase CheR
MDGSVTEGNDRFNRIGMPALSDEQFERLRRIGHRLAGLELRERHREFLERRLRRLGADEKLLASWVDAADEGEAAAVQRIIGLLTTKHTGFFRHPLQFDMAAEHLLWAAHRRGRAGAWSAAAATGEEPYSLAMAVLEVFRRDSAPVRILATDIDENALIGARVAEYGDRAVQDLDARRRARFLVARTESRWEIAPCVRDLVEFRALNVVDGCSGFSQPLDVVFCRNVLMYLAEPQRIRVIERIAAVLAHDGLLFIDPTEHLGAAAHLFSPRGAGVYCLRRAAPLPPTGFAAPKCRSAEEDS